MNTSMNAIAITSKAISKLGHRTRSVFSNSKIRTYAATSTATVAAATTCLIALSNSNSNSFIHRHNQRTTCCDPSTTSPSASGGRGDNYGNGRARPRPPPLYGKSIPYYIIKRDMSSESGIFNNGKKGTGSSQRDMDSISKASKEGNTSTDNAEGAGNEKNRSDCPLCQKYSQGPCGTLFTKWMDCIDRHQTQTSTSSKSNKSDGDESQSECDHLMIPLDQCLKEHEEFYDKISLYTDDNDITEDSISDWKGFILDLEKAASTTSASSSSSEVKPQLQLFPNSIEPEMQLRPKQNMGAAMFHKTDGQDRILLLAYVKDQDGHLLGAGSVEDLFDFQGQYVLRFRVSSSSGSGSSSGSSVSSDGTSKKSGSKDVTAYALYQNECESTDEDREDEDVVIYHKTERIPSP